MATTCKLIAKTTLGSTAASVTFSSIPATYTDLLVLVSAQTTSGTGASSIKIRFNGASTDTNHTSRVLQGNGASVASYTYTIAHVGEVPGSGTSAWCNNEIYIPNYAGSANKSISASSVTEYNATTAYISASAALWSSTAAITQIQLLSGTMSIGSSFFLYGITKA